MEKELLKIVDDTKDIPLDINSTELITSTRSYGVELEMILGNVNKINDYCNNHNHNVHRDGSILGDNAIEVASDVLVGEDGAKRLVDLMDKCRDFGFKTNGSCGTHIHLGAKDFYTKDNHFKEINIENIKIEDENLFVELPLYNQLKKVYSNDQIFSLLAESVSKYYENGTNTWFDNYTMSDGRTSNICIVPCLYLGNYSKILIRVSTLERLKLKAFNLGQRLSSLIIDKKSTEVYINRNGRQCADIGVDKILLFTKKTSKEWVRLKTLLYVYSYFDDLFFGMLPKNRKKSEYCRPLINTYSYDDIQKIMSQENLEKTWYKEQKLANVARAKRQRGALHGDFNTRYHSLNIHALFYESGYNTIEIRTHHGTLNAKSILAWVALHQKILDDVSNNYSHFIDSINYVNKNSSLEEKVKQFFNMFNIKKDSEIYNFIKHRLSVYSSLNLK